MSIERLIQIICGFDPTFVITKVKHDLNLMMSFYRQLNRDIALTDRQGALAIIKLRTYSEEFKTVGIDVDNEVATPFYEKGLRQINREHKIFIDESNNKKIIALKFPFSKKVQTQLRSIEKKLTGLGHKDFKNNHFVLNENNIYHIVKTFQDTFEIEEKLQNYYDKIVDLKNQNFSIVCDIDRENTTLPALALTALEKEIGQVSESNCHLVVDRQMRFGYKASTAIKETFKSKLLTEFSKIVADRPCERIFVDRNRKEYSYKHFGQMFTELQRWPCLVVLGQEGKDWAPELINIVECFSEFIKMSEISVLTRLNSDTEYGQKFNNLIKDYSVNNMVDNNTKCVIIDSNKLPKFLIKDNVWKPLSTIYVNVVASSGKVQVINDQCDLRILYGTKAPSTNFYEC